MGRRGRRADGAKGAEKGLEQRGAEKGAEKGLEKKGERRLAAAGEQGEKLKHGFEIMCSALRELQLPKVEFDKITTVDSWLKNCARSALDSAEIDPRYHAFNPSILSHPFDSDNFLVLLRGGNYFMSPHGVYNSPMGHVGTRNWYGVVSEQELTDKTLTKIAVKAEELVVREKPPFPRTDIRGLEDARFLWEPSRGHLYITFTSLEMTKEQLPTVCMAKLRSGSGDSWRIADGKVVALRGFQDHRQQKNWAFFAWRGRIFAVYSFTPMLVLQVDPDTGEVWPISLDMHAFMVPDLRGSSPLVPLDPAWKCVKALKNFGDWHRAGDEWFAAAVHISAFPKYHHPPRPAHAGVLAQQHRRQAPHLHARLPFRAIPFAPARRGAVRARRVQLRPRLFRRRRPRLPALRLHGPRGPPSPPPRPPPLPGPRRRTPSRPRLAARARPRPVVTRLCKVRAETVSFALFSARRGEGTNQRRPRRRERRDVGRGAEGAARGAVGSQGAPGARVRDVQPGNR